MTADTTLHRFSAISVAFLAVMMVWQFHDQSWWAPADGAYAHIAERVLKGEVLNGSIHDVHLGLVHFVHAASFKLFGASMVGLRYPLALLTVLQCLIVFWLFRDRDWMTALAAGIAMAALTFVQFVNPSSSWYALFATVCLIAAVSWIPRDAGFRYGVLGWLTMIVVMFQQQTGALVALGLVTYLLCETSSRSAYSRPVLGRTLLALGALVLGFFLFKTASPVSIVLFGIWPMGLIAVCWVNCVMSDRAVVRMILQLTLGAVVALSPLLLYHVFNGSLISWFDDTILTGLRLLSLGTPAQPGYAALPIDGIISARGLDVQAVINALFWGALLLAPVLLGAFTVSRAIAAGESAPPFPHMAVFFAVVSAQHGATVNLIYSAAMTLCGLMALSDGWTRRLQSGVAGGVLLLAGIGIWSHAGEPVIPGTQSGTQASQPGEPLATPRKPLDFRVGLRVSPEDRALYQWLVPLIVNNSGAEDSILALPANPELYFMARRRNPTRFTDSAQGLRRSGAVEILLSTLVIDPPALVILAEEDGSVTRNTRRVIDQVRRTYQLIAARDGVEVYAAPR